MPEGEWMCPRCTRWDILGARLGADGADERQQAVSADENCDSDDFPSLPKRRRFSAHASEEEKLPCDGVVPVDGDFD